MIINIFCYKLIHTFFVGLIRTCMLLFLFYPFSSLTKQETGSYLKKKKKTMVNNTTSNPQWLRISAPGQILPIFSNPTAWDSSYGDCAPVISVASTSPPSNMAGGRRPLRQPYSLLRWPPAGTRDSRS